MARPACARHLQGQQVSLATSHLLTGSTVSGWILKKAEKMSFIMRRLLPVGVGLGVRLASRAPASLQRAQGVRSYATHKLVLCTLLLCRAVLLGAYSLISR